MFVGHLYVFGEMSRSSTQFFNGLLVFFCLYIYIYFFFPPNYQVVFLLYS